MGRKLNSPVAAMAFSGIFLASVPFTFHSIECRVIGAISRAPDAHLLVSPTCIFFFFLFPFRFGGASSLGVLRTLHDRVHSGEGGGGSYKCDNLQVSNRFIYFSPCVGVCMAQFFVGFGYGR